MSTPVTKQPAILKPRVPLYYPATLTLAALGLLAAYTLCGATPQPPDPLPSKSASATNAGAGGKNLEAKWGEPVEGVQVRLWSKQTNWTERATPRVFVDVRNQGTRQLMVQTKQMHGCELEVDGRWFRRPQNTREIRALPSPFGPGREYNGIVLNLDQYWEVVVSQDVRRSRRTVPERLRLVPGKHLIRVAVTATPAKSEPGKAIRAISNPIELGVIAKNEGALN